MLGRRRCVAEDAAELQASVDLPWIATERADFDPRFHCAEHRGIAVRATPAPLAFHSLEHRLRRPTPGRQSCRVLPLASPPHAHQDSVELAAARLFRAARDGLACAPVRELIGADDTELAYRVQRELTRRRVRAGARIVGRKVGLTARSVQDQLGVDRPDFGVLFDDMRVPSHEAVPTQRLIQPKAEAEVAFILAQDLDVADLDMSTVRASVRHAVAAIEIVDSRIADWDISFGDTVADNASSGLFVLGDHPASLDEFEPRNVTMTMTVNGAVVSSGSGRDCLGDPLEALAWLARTAVEIGDPLRAGQIVLSGALGPMRPVGPGDVVQAYVTGLGEVTARFSAGACA